MTRALAGSELAGRISESHAGAVASFDDVAVWIELDSLPEVARFLRDDQDLEFGTLTAVSATDYIEYYELIYHLLSMKRNHSAILKAKCYGREEPTARSVIDVWRGADLQEREIWDLMGVRFEGHPNMKRIMLWEEFQGHPLRKDFLR